METNLTENLNYCNNAIAIKNDIEGNFLILSEHLYNIKEHNLFEPQWSSFLEFCFELKMTQNTINKMIQVYKKFVLEYEIDSKLLQNAGVSLLVDVLPIIRTKKQAMKWVDKACLLTRQDLRKELVEEKSGISMIDCKHEDYYILKICKVCGDRQKINEKEQTKNISDSKANMVRVQKNNKG